jgi:hypothetical protein
MPGFAVNACTSAKCMASSLKLLYPPVLRRPVEVTVKTGPSRRWARMSDLAESGRSFRSVGTTEFRESRGGISPPRAPRTVREPLDSYGSRCSAIGTSNGSASSTRLLPFPVGPWPRLNNAAPSVQPHYRAFLPTTSCSAPVLRIGTLTLAVCAAWMSPFASERQVLTFRTRA